MCKFLIFLEVLAQINLCKIRHSVLSFSFLFIRCNKGYTLEGEKESSCLASSSWSHSPPLCELVKCSSPEDINNGKYILSGLTYLSTASYSCENGYRYSPRHQPSFLQYPVPHYLLSGFHLHVTDWLEIQVFKCKRYSQMCMRLEAQPIVNAQGNIPSNFDSGTSNSML